GEILATARAYDARVEIIADVAHNMMLELRWQAVAARILMWLEEWELTRRPASAEGEAPASAMGVTASSLPHERFSQEAR
ncbi:MAG TPA: hypothetical protein VFN38_06090, partial [Gemmatimonadaceae bacterium]|nr:hypothetical protein [Gemmatimonadaceae bacterium]